MTTEYAVVNGRLRVVTRYIIDVADDQLATLTVRFRDGRLLTLDGAYLVSAGREQADAGPQVVIRLGISENAVWTDNQLEGNNGAAIP